MIKLELDIAPYCEKCRRWYPEIKEFSTSTMGGEHTSINRVQCEHKTECTEMYRFLKEQENEQH